MDYRRIPNLRFRQSLHKIIKIIIVPLIILSVLLPIFLINQYVKFRKAEVIHDTYDKCTVVSTDQDTIYNVTGEALLYKTDYVFSEDGKVADKIKVKASEYILLRDKNDELIAVPANPSEYRTGEVVYFHQPNEIKKNVPSLEGFFFNTIWFNILLGIEVIMVITTFLFGAHAFFYVVEVRHIQTNDVHAPKPNK